MLARTLVRAAVLTAVFVASGACAREAAEGTHEQAGDLSPQQAHALIARSAGNPEFVVLDIRTPGEFAAGHLPGAVNVDFRAPDFQARAAALDRGKTYLVYCRTGHRSGLAMPILERLGFAHLAHLVGGITAWQRDGFPVELPPAP